MAGLSHHPTSTDTKKLSYNLVKQIQLIPYIIPCSRPKLLQLVFQVQGTTLCSQDIFAAGSETSSTAVDWAIAEMIKNPRVMNMAQNEVREVFNRKGQVDETCIREMKYLNLVIKETLRLNPPGPLLVPRECREKYEIDGYEIPVKSRVIVNAWAIGRDPNYWNEPESFNPDGFLDSSIDYKGTNFEYIPFGAGRRMCPGVSFGLANVELPLALLLYHFDWKLPSGMKHEYLDTTEAFGGAAKRKEDLHLIPIPSTEKSQV
ncbi:hypothetical protein GBA52_014564 [Prunus armeniaca]|nr:hypothetical protein GBA52_014564 [Prunus armeniaca]